MERFLPHLLDELKSSLTLVELRENVTFSAAAFRVNSTRV
jgi:hypothetical protein